MLGVSTLGVGLMVGGIIFSVTGGALSKKADKAYYQALEIERQVDAMLPFLEVLDKNARKYQNVLKSVQKRYKEEFEKMDSILNKKIDWKEFSKEEKQIVQNCVLLVGLLFKMCKVNLVNKGKSESDANTVNIGEIDSTLEDVETIMQKELAA